MFIGFFVEHRRSATYRTWVRLPPVGLPWKAFTKQGRGLPCGRILEPLPNVYTLAPPPGRVPLRQRFVQWVVSGKKLPGKPGREENRSLTLTISVWQEEDTSDDSRERHRGLVVISLWCPGDIRKTLNPGRVTLLCPVDLSCLGWP